MLLQRAEAGTLRGLQVYLGNVLVEPAQESPALMIHIEDGGMGGRRELNAR